MKARLRGRRCRVGRQAATIEALDSTIVQKKMTE